MAHRAEKNRLAHGYHTTMVGTGEKATYTTDRPPYTPGKGSGPRGKGSIRSQYSTKSWGSSTAQNRGRGYRNVGEVVRQAPKRDKWRPRHV